MLYTDSSFWDNFFLFLFIFLCYYLESNFNNYFLHMI